jgi:epoxyqueuosine reductase
MDLNKQIKELVNKNNIDYVGFGPVQRWSHAPPGHRPGDLLPGAKSVVVLGMRVSQGPQLTQRRALVDRQYRQASFAYRWFGYGMLNQYFNDKTAILVSKLLEQAGEIALPIVGSGVEDAELLMGAMSNRHAAVAAGLGEFGWNGLCLTPDVGPRARFASIVTTAELEPTPMYNGPKLCNPEKCAQMGKGVPICVRLCPIQAYSRTKSVKVVIGEKTMEYAYMDHLACSVAGMGMHPRVLGPENIKVPRKVNFQTVTGLASQKPPLYMMENMVFGRGHYCGMCLLRCPVGSPKLVDAIMKDKETIE